MHAGLLHTHNAIRWIVLGLCLYCVARATAADSKRRELTPGDRKSLLALVIAVDTQLLFGLMLYFVTSPLTKVAFANFGMAMKDRGLRYWAVEHGFGMIAAIALVHIAKMRAKKAGTDEEGLRALHGTRRALVIALLLFLLMQPWPFLPYGRGLIP